jgi:hypothetical protein
MIMKSTRIATASLLAMAAAFSAARAEVTVQLVDGQSAGGHAFAVKAGRVTLTGADGKALGKWTVDNVARILPAAPDEAPPADPSGWVQVVGGWLRGNVETFDGKIFQVTGADFGPMTLPVACVRAVVLTPDVPNEFAGPDAATDLVALANGDRLNGILNRLDDKQVAFHSDLGDLKLERSRVAAVRIAAPTTGRPRPGRPALKVTVRSGAAVELSAVETTGDGNLTGTLAGGPRIAVPIGKIAAIEVVGGRLHYLETLEPEAYQQFSLDVLKWKIRRGLNVLGRPMQLRRDKGGKPETFERGLGVHGPCRVVYDLAGRFERFIALVGIDESAGQWADANVLVKVDGKEAFRADHLKWREPARAVNVRVAGAKRLELVVEAGEHFDVQDRIDWAEARLIRAAETGGR